MSETVPANPAAGEAAAAVDRLLRALAATALVRRVAYDRLDAAAGDGDFGSTLARGATALVHSESVRAGSAAARLRAAAQAMTDAMGGSSGPLCGAALLRAAGVLAPARALGGGSAGDAAAGGSAAAAGAAEARAGADDDAPLDDATIARSVAAAAAGIADYGGAGRGDKTVLDALEPLAEALAADGRGAAAAAARDGADASAGLRARRGRASYGGDAGEGSPDPGAVAVADVTEQLASGEALPSWNELESLAAAERGDADADDQPAPRGFHDDPTTLVDDALTTFARVHTELVHKLPGIPAIVRRRRDGDPPRVALVSGGGSGHEPLHAGFVGAGMLDAAAAGAVFTSPPPSTILAATVAADIGAGVLHVVKQYTGDVLNFRLAAELAAAEGIEVAAVIVDDDVALPADAPTGRRGTGATVAVEKIAGALAAEGATLAEVAAVARRVADRGRSFGVALHGDEMELGVGIHGEPGRARQPLASAPAIAAALLQPILAEDAIAPSAPLLVQLSGLGGTPPLELHLLLGHVVRELEQAGRTVARLLVGDLVTSLDQPGAVLTLVALDDELLRLWDAPALTPALQKS